MKAWLFLLNDTEFLLKKTTTFCTSPETCSDQHKNKCHLKISVADKVILLFSLEVWQGFISREHLSFVYEQHEDNNLHILAREYRWFENSRPVEE